MDEINHSPILPAETFILFHFALGPSDPARPPQRVRRLGEFDTAEEAFRAARTHALRDAAALACTMIPARSTGRGDPAIALLSTEWGYDVKREYQVFSRFWIHAHPVRAE